MNHTTSMIAAIFPRGTTAVVKQCRKLIMGPFDTYHPELHYMRGPGPKWRERHARVAITVPGPR